jgi:membrane protein required for colicin V production|tara:strand:- start:163 stop:663 length:501 start_codon:yes stop_codon:yes gene_type:complete
MTPIDYAIIVIILLSICFGCFRGFIRELLSLIGWFLAFYTANFFTDSLYQYIPFALDETIKYIAGYFIIFLLVLIFASIIIKLINKFIKSVGLSFSNFILGGFFGFTRGVLIIFVMILLLEKTSFSLNPGWAKSTYIPIIKNSVENTLPYLPEDWFKDVKYDNILT